MAGNLERVPVCQFPYRKLDSYAIKPTRDQPAREAAGDRHTYSCLQKGTAGSWRSGNRASGGSGSAGAAGQAGRRRFPTPTRAGDPRRRDSRSGGRNVPRAPGSRKSGDCPSLLPPQPSAPSPHGAPSGAFSLFLRRTKLPSSAPSPFRGPLLSSRRVFPQGDPPRLLISPRPTAASITKSPRSQRPPTAAAPPGPQASPTAPPCTPFTCFSSRGREAGAARAPGAGGGAPSGWRAYPSRGGETAPSRGACPGSGWGLFPRLLRRNPRLPLPVYAAAAPETAELQPLQPIPAQPQPGRGTPSCIIHERPFRSATQRSQCVCGTDKAPPTDQ